MVKIIDPWNRVNGNIQTVVKKDYPKCSFTTDKEDTPPTLPCVCVEQVDLPTHTDLEINECMVTSVIEIKTYSSKDLPEARKLGNICADAMAFMGYTRKYGPKKIDNPNATNIKSTIARYQRLVGDVSDIEKMS